MTYKFVYEVAPKGSMAREMFLFSTWLCQGLVWCGVSFRSCLLLFCTFLIEKLRMYDDSLCCGTKRGRRRERSSRNLRLSNCIEAWNLRHLQAPISLEDMDCELNILIRSSFVFINLSWLHTSVLYRKELILALKAVFRSKLHRIVIFF